VRHWFGSLRIRRRAWALGRAEVADARRIADAERSAGVMTPQRGRQGVTKSGNSNCNC